MELRIWRVTPRSLVAFFLLQTLVSYSSGIFRWLAGANHSVFWPTVGVGFVALVTAVPGQLRRLAVVHGVAVTTGLFLRDPTAPQSAFAFGAANSIEVFVVAWIYLRLSDGDVWIRTGKNVVRMVVAGLIGAVVMAVMCGFIYGFVREPFSPGTFYTKSAVAIFFGHMSGLTMLAPMFLTTSHRQANPAYRMETVLQALTLGVVLWFVFHSANGLPMDFLPFAALAWAAVRLGPKITAAELFGTAVVVTVATLRHWGPFAEYGLEQDIPQGASVLSVIYQLTLLGTILSLALVVNRVREAARRLAASEDLYRRTFDDAMLGMVMLDRCVPGGGSSISRVNPVAARFLGDESPGVIGTGILAYVSQQDHEKVHHALTEVFAGTTEAWSGQVQINPGAERELHVSMTLSPLRDADGSVNRVAVQMADVTDAQLATERLEDLALHDPLTGLANRTLLEDRLQYWLEISGRDCSQLLLLYIDLDDFKYVNDTAGHETGDQLLLEVSRRLLEALRPQDTVARLGGDEFVVIAPQMPGDAREVSSVLSARLLSAVSAPYRLGGETYSVGASIGMTLSRADSTATSLMREADAAMYEAKRQGKNCRHLFEPSSQDAVSERVIILNELNDAFTKDEFELHIQPMIDLPTGKVVGGEALVRWRHPERGLLQPAVWLDIAEESDLVHRLGAWVIDEACRQAAHWQQVMGAESPIIHANVSAKQLGHGTLLDDVRGALARSGLSPDKLVLELTETQLERSEQAVKADFDGLRAEGIHIAADDFGTGYSSLTRLTDMPIDILKIDRTFVARMSRDERARAVVAALVTMGSAIGMEVVAEGVETLDEASHLRDLGCGQGQGFLWSRPVPSEEFLDLAMHRVAVLDCPVSNIPSQKPRSGSAELQLP